MKQTSSGVNIPVDIKNPIYCMRAKYFSIIISIFLIVHDIYLQEEIVVNVTVAK